MDLLDKANIFHFHGQLIKEFGVSSNAALGWKEPSGQAARFKILSGIGQLNGHSVLDAGCGHADMFAYLIKLYPQLLYYGIEQIPGILQVAIDRYIHLPAVKFYEGDFTTGVLPVVDYTIACGSLNYRNSDDLFIFKTIEKLFNNSRIGLGFNLLSKIEPVTGFLTAYHPDHITGFCRTLTSHVSLIENYYGDDYTVLMYH
jgi:SAM-dependent methyltransferase